MWNFFKRKTVKIKVSDSIGTIRFKDGREGKISRKGKVKVFLDDVYAVHGHEIIQDYLNARGDFARLDTDVLVNVRDIESVTFENSEREEEI